MESESRQQKARGGERPSASKRPRTSLKTVFEEENGEQLDSAVDALEGGPDAQNVQLAVASPLGRASARVGAVRIPSLIWLTLAVLLLYIATLLGTRYLLDIQQPGSTPRETPSQDAAPR